MDGLVGKIIRFLFGSPGFLAGGEGRSPVVSAPRFAPSSWIGIARHVGITFPRQFAIGIQHGEELHASAGNVGNETSVTTNEPEKKN